MKYKIAIVEDHQHVAKLLEFKLKNEGYEVQILSDGFFKDEQTLLTGNFDLILLDLMLPGKSGLELLVELRRQESTRYTPVIILSGKTLEQDVVKGLSFGADDYIKKPFSPREVAIRIKTHLTRGRKAIHERQVIEEAAQAGKTYYQWDRPDRL